MRPTQSLPPRVRDLLTILLHPYGLHDVDAVLRFNYNHKDTRIPGHSREDVMAARDAITWALYHTPGPGAKYPSTSTVGRWLGRDHSSIITSLQRHKGRLGVTAQDRAA